MTKSFAFEPMNAPAPTTPRGLEVARWFGLHRPGNTRRATPEPLTRRDLASLLPGPGEITLVIGPSGAGKSSLLRTLRGLQLKHTCWINLSARILPALPVVDCFGEDPSLNEVLSSLARVGLAEVWTFLRRPNELSEGQRWRLRLALALHAAKSMSHPDRGRIHHGSTVLVIDEFAALLDRITALIVARTLRRAMECSRRGNRTLLGALVATSHDDLIHTLDPDTIVHCDFGRLTVRRIPRARVTRQTAISGKSRARNTPESRTPPRG
jgi:ABC-type ATPase with predicted acetyltransferase domain